MQHAQPGARLVHPQTYRPPNAGMPGERTKQARARLGQLWGRRVDDAFAEDSPASYPEALLLAAEPGSLRVDIEPATTVRGDPCYAILVADRDPDFWMDHKPTRRAAEVLCKAIGWRVRR